jgi:hypothetical protein
MVWELKNEPRYRSIFENSQSVFHSADFNALNRFNAENVYYLVAKIENVQFGIILGKRGKTLFSPFSSPFGGIECLGNREGIDYKETIDSLIEFCRSFNIEKLQISLPPEIYFEHGNYIPSNKFIQSEFKEIFIDKSYHINLRNHDSFQLGLKRNRSFIKTA